MSEFNAKDFKTGDTVVVKGTVSVWNNRRIITIDSDILFYNDEQSDNLEIIEHIPACVEPTRLGAVVEVDGVPFVRADDSDVPWYGNSEWVSWREIHVFHGRPTVKFEGPEIAL